MTRTSEPILFFGSGPVAAKSLSLLAADFEIEAVITKPRPAHHKGDVPVLRVAEKFGLPVKTATDKKSLSQLFAYERPQSRVGVLIDFGIIVPQEVIDVFPLGIINSHFSILPEWRGADPITFAILSGQQTSGVSLMQLVEALDEGPLLGFGELELAADITTPELTSSLIDLSHQLLKEILPAYLAGNVIPAPQSVTGRDVSYSRKLSKNDAVLDWTKPALQLDREIRAYIEWPRSCTTFANIQVGITKARVTALSGIPGRRDVIDKEPVVFCGVGGLVIERLKPAGKKEMTGKEFLAGYKRHFLEAG